MGKWGRRLVIIPIVFLIAMVFGNHKGKLEDIWLIGLAAVLLLLVVWDARRRKNAWRSS
jgi:hypothetical protein